MVMSVCVPSPSQPNLDRKLPVHSHSFGAQSLATTPPQVVKSIGWRHGFCRPKDCMPRVAERCSIDRAVALLCADKSGLSRLGDDSPSIPGGPNQQRRLLWPGLLEALEQVSFITLLVTRPGVTQQHQRHRRTVFRRIALQGTGRRVTEPQCHVMGRTFSNMHCPHHATALCHQRCGFGHRMRT